MSQAEIDTLLDTESTVSFHIDDIYGLQEDARGYCVFDKLKDVISALELYVADSSEEVNTCPDEDGLDETHA